MRNIGMDMDRTALDLTEIGRASHVRHQVPPLLTWLLLRPMPTSEVIIDLSCS